jgi:hypothetical protein
MGRIFLTNADKAITLFPSELRVGLEHVYGEGNFVHDALSRPMTTGEQFEIGDVVEAPITVDVMDSLLWEKLTTEMLFHDIPMFEHLAAGLALFGWNPDRDVPALHARGHNTIRKAFVERIALGFGFAFVAAKFLGAIVSDALSFTATVLPHRRSLSALNASKEGALLGHFMLFSAKTFAGAVGGLFAVLLDVSRQIALLHKERAATMLARKLCGLRTRTTVILSSIRHDVPQGLGFRAIQVGV